MTKINDESAERKSGRVIVSYMPTVEDLVQANAMQSTECPRRYCWWWKTADFQWEIGSAQGCGWPDAVKRPHWTYKDFPCCRADPNSSIDQYEPHNFHQEDDGIDGAHWWDALQQRRRAQELE